MNNIKIDADLRPATHDESLETLRRQMRTVLGINLVNSALIAGFTWQHANHNLLILWGFAVWVLSLVRVDLWRRYGKIDHPIEIDETQQLRFFVFTSGLSGLLWGLAPVLFFTPILTPHQLFLLFVAGGMAAGATATLFVDRLSYYVFVCPSSKHLGLLSLFSNGGSGSSWFDVKRRVVDGSSGGSVWSVF